MKPKNIYTRVNPPIKYVTHTVEWRWPYDVPLPPQCLPGPNGEKSHWKVGPDLQMPTIKITFDKYAYSIREAVDAVLKVYHDDDTGLALLAAKVARENETPPQEDTRQVTGVEIRLEADPKDKRPCDR